MTVREARIWNSDTQQWEFIGTAPGEQGPKGDKGDTGPAGPVGAPGTDGVVLSPTPPANPIPGLLWLNSSKEVPDIDPFPDQTGHANQFLSTDGTNVSWEPVGAGDSLPDQTGQAGKFLTTDGSAPSWGSPGGLTVPTVPNASYVPSLIGASTSNAIWQFRPVTYALVFIRQVTKYPDGIPSFMESFDTNLASIKFDNFQVTQPVGMFYNGAYADGKNPVIVATASATSDQAYYNQSQLGAYVQANMPATLGDKRMFFWLSNLNPWNPNGSNNQKIKSAQINLFLTGLPMLKTQDWPSFAGGLQLPTAPERKWEVVEGAGDEDGAFAGACVTPGCWNEGEVFPLTSTDGVPNSLICGVCTLDISPFCWKVES